MPSPFILSLCGLPFFGFLCLCCRLLPCRVCLVGFLDTVWLVVVGLFAACSFNRFLVHIRLAFFLSAFVALPRVCFIIVGLVALCVVSVCLVGHVFKAMLR